MEICVLLKFPARGVPPGCADSTWPPDPLSDPVPHLPRPAADMRDGADSSAPSGLSPSAATASTAVAATSTAATVTAAPTAVAATTVTTTAIAATTVTAVAAVTMAAMAAVISVTAVTAVTAVTVTAVAAVAVTMAAVTVAVAVTPISVAPATVTHGGHGRARRCGDGRSGRTRTPQGEREACHRGEGPPGNTHDNSPLPGWFLGLVEARGCVRVCARAAPGLAAGDRTPQVKWRCPNRLLSPHSRRIHALSAMPWSQYTHQRRSARRTGSPTRHGPAPPGAGVVVLTGRSSRSWYPPSEIGPQVSVPPSSAARWRRPVRP